MCSSDLEEAGAEPGLAGGADPSGGELVGEVDGDGVHADDHEREGPGLTALDVVKSGVLFSFVALDVVESGVLLSIIGQRLMERRCETAGMALCVK